MAGDGGIRQGSADGNDAAEQPEEKDLRAGMQGGQLKPREVNTPVPIIEAMTSDVAAVVPGARFKRRQ